MNILEELKANEAQNKVMYADIINLPRHQSVRHQPMSMLKRAAQFGAFAAVSGHYEALAECARHTEEKVTLGEDQRELLDYTLAELRMRQTEHPFIKIKYFVPDTFKEGGAYKVLTERLQRIDEQNGKIILLNGTEIRVGDIIDMHEYNGNKE